MARLSDLTTSPVTKMLLMGDSGSGKTGAVMSLIATGYNVRVLDLDNGLKVLQDYFINPDSAYRKPRPGLWDAKQAASLADRFWYETLTDKMKASGAGQLVPVSARVWPKLTETLNKWPGLGPVSGWGPQDVLVLDSLTFAAKAAMNFVLSMNARLGQKPWQEDWGVAQGYLDGLLQLLYDEGVNCNIIVNCHMKLFGPDGGVQKWFPETLGKALSPNIGRYFNTVLQAKTVGAGSATRRVITTVSSQGIELKTPCPLRVQKEYDISTGLAEYFAAERSGTAADPTPSGPKPAGPVL